MRRAGITKCETFSSRAAAKAWAATIEQQAEELRASGVMQPRGLSVGDLIDRYIEEMYPMKPWGRSKSADLARLKKELGGIAASDLTSHRITEHFRKRRQEDSGAVAIAALVGYLVGVLTVARVICALIERLERGLVAGVTLEPFEALEALNLLELVLDGRDARDYSGIEPAHGPRPQHTARDRLIASYFLKLRELEPRVRENVHIGRIAVLVGLSQRIYVVVAEHPHLGKGSADSTTHQVGGHLLTTRMERFDSV